MKMRIRAKMVVLTGVLVLQIQNSGAAPRPNIVLVMADDQGWGQVGATAIPS